MCAKLNLQWIIAERNSPSDDELICIALKIENGMFVETYDAVYELEGAKTIFEVIAKSPGYFYSLIKVGDIVTAGDSIGIISAIRLDDERIIELTNQLLTRKTNDIALIGGYPNMSAAACKVMEKLDDLTKKKLEEHFQTFDFVREKDITNYLESLQVSTMRISKRSIEGWKSALAETKKLEKVYFVGGGFGSLQVLDILLTSKKYHLSGYFSDSITNVLDEIDIPRIGKCTEESYKNLSKVEPNFAAIVTVSVSPEFRFRQIEILARLGINLPNILHPTVVLGRNSELGVGNVLFANVHVGTDVVIGNGNIISSNSTIEHHNIVGNGNTLGPQVATSGNVKIGDRCRFGSGVIVEPGIEIGSEVIIASSATLTSNVKSNTTVKVISNLRLS